MPHRLTLPLAVIAGLLGALSAAQAQKCDRADESQAGMNICAAADHQAADRKLNKAYGDIMKRLSDDADARKRLQAAQRAWIAFRDAECDFSTADSREGTIYPALYSECLTALTDERTGQLSGYLNCEEGDMSCPVPPAP
ncbi:MAG: lysozyme inhibitor LprI family protein [Rhizobiaceae bacterium]